MTRKVALFLCADNFLVLLLWFNYITFNKKNVKMKEIKKDLKKSKMSNITWNIKKKIQKKEGKKNE